MFRTLLCSALTALAVVASTPAPARAEALTPLSVDYGFVHRTTLDNGLEVVVIESRQTPIVTVEIAVRNGAFTQEPAFSGLSHLYEHMFFKANAELPSQEAYLARQRELGMSWNGTTSEERVNYFFTLQTHNLEAGMRFMNAAIRTPRFDEQELVREREVVLGEYDRNESNPGFHLSRAVAERLWYEHASRKDALGDRAAISAATVEQMRWMQQAYYVPNNSLLVLSGDLDAQTGFDLARSIFGDWARADDPHQKYPVPEHPPLPASTAALVPQEVGVSVVQVAWHGPDTRGDLDATYAADVLSYILAQDGARFQQRLVASGKALQASLGYQTLRYTGQISLTLVTQPGRENEAIEAARAELAALVEPGYFSADELRSAQTLLAVSDLYNQQSSTDLAHTLSYWWASASIDYYLGYIEALRRVTEADMQRYLRRYVIDKPAVVALMSGADAIEQGGWTEASLLAAWQGGAP
jgi:zinc protease